MMMSHYGKYRQLDKIEKQMIQAILNNDIDLFYKLQRERLKIQVGDIIKNNPELEGEISMDLYNKQYNSTKAKMELRHLIFLSVQSTKRKIAKIASKKLDKEYTHTEIKNCLIGDIVIEFENGITLSIF